MRIRVHMDSARLFRWHLALLDALEAARHDVCISYSANPEPLPISLTAVFDAEHALMQKHLGRLSTHMDAQAFAKFRSCDEALQPDITLDLASATRITKLPGRVLRPAYDGSYKDYALFQAVLDQRTPALWIADSAGGDKAWRIGTPAISDRWRAARAFDQITSRLVEGLAGTVVHVANGEMPREEPPERTNYAGRSAIFSAAATFASRRAVHRLSSLAGRIAGDRPKWHVAWRRAQAKQFSPGIIDLADFRTLADDGRRYYADPHAIEHEGTTHVFIEEYPATGHGIISHFEIAADGTPTVPKPVLEMPFHLSYPAVFRHNGDFWMLPESSCAGGLDLYRAERFPDRWVKHARVLDGRLHDATLFTHEGRWWIASASDTLQSSAWDALSLFYADDLAGPWKPHSGNPVVVDAQAARPAGPIWKTADGAIMRPAQDCSDGYGHKLTLRRISKLDPETFVEETTGQIAFPSEQSIYGPHTLSRTSRFEIVDLFARPSALRAAYRHPAKSKLPLHSPG